MFRCVLKHADVIPEHENETKTDKGNYRPVSIPLNLSKIYEKLMYQRLYEPFNSILSLNILCFEKVIALNIA